MKKIISIIISFILALSVSFTALASNSATVSADAVSLSTEEQIIVPVKISNNKGIMGFKINVKYPTEEIDVRSVSVGEVTSVGNFNTNFGVNDGTFDVLWNNTEDVKLDGSLFVLSIKAKKEIKKDTKLSITFSQPDTFNEKYEDVVLDCKDIVVSAKMIETTQPKQEDTTSKVTAPLNNSQVISAVKITLENNNVKSLKDVKDKDKFVKEFNKNLSEITGTNDYNVDSFDSLLSLYNSSYEGAYVTDVTMNVEPERLNEIIKETLGEYHVNNVNELKDKDKAEFVKKVQDKIKEEYPDASNIAEDVETDEALNIIDKVYNSTSNPNEEVKEKKSSNKSVYICVAVGVFLIILVLGILFAIKKKKSKK